jgi:prepilin-type N-terminal cleavage/methylation domain-containing protein/prepilin-type processing-associated H-X9-DG protein
MLRYRLGFPVMDPSFVPGLRPPLVRGRGAFTLIELLVVIAIIAILAVLAFPAAQRVVTSGQTAKSTSNLRQIGALLSSYVGDNNNRLPAYEPASWSTATNSKFWQNVLRLHAGLPVRGNPEKDTWLPEIFYDPVVKNDRQHLWGCFGANSAVMRKPNGTPMAAITTPSKKVLVASAVDTSAQNRFDSSWYFNGTSVTTGPAKVDARHGGRVLCLFVDGHTEVLDVGKMTAAERRGYFQLEGN